MDRVESTLTIGLALILVATLGYGAWWLYDCFCGPWLDMPIVVAGPEPPRPKTYQVLPGDNLWAIATGYYPGQHIGEVIHEIRKLNGMTQSATIYPYEVLQLP